MSLMVAEIVITTQPCPICNTTADIVVAKTDAEAWRRGAYIQDVFTYLSRGDRERLISGYCDPCFDSMFPPEPVEETCPTCEAAAPGTPSHVGSTGCTSGSRSIAAGGVRSHCSCDSCY